MKKTKMTRRTMKTRRMMVMGKMKMKMKMNDERGRCLFIRGDYNGICSIAMLPLAFVRYREHFTIINPRAPVSLPRIFRRYRGETLICLVE